MSELTAEDFSAFYSVLYGYPLFPWQVRLLQLVLQSGWPTSIDLPTASGKTACIDIAVFAMAVRQSGPRRVFFVVDRRVVVDAAFDRMSKMAGKLTGAKEGVLRVVADRLRWMATGAGGVSDACPLEAYQLRGGIYRDNGWVDNPLQPMVIASTVDQVGSRILFRGYGVSEELYPMHAALVANDSLLLLDEAHYSRPFAQTLQAIRRYRSKDWTVSGLETPFAFVEMTATPVASVGEPFQLDAKDYENAVLRQRLFAAKPAELVVSKARLRDYEKFASDLAQKAVAMSARAGIRRIAVMVNRVNTAREVFRLLKDRRAHLLIGRMRPIDRLELPEDLQAILSREPRKADDEPIFVVATQCLEVGADLDFDGLVTECASIEALQQRFGRLDRTGELSVSRTVPAACVMIPTPMTDAKYEDPIYGPALSATWNWLRAAGETADFGNLSEGGSTVRERLRSLAESEAAKLRRVSPLCPTLLPAHLDLFVQTNPVPAADPDPSFFLHGKESAQADVQVVWRADLSRTNEKWWIDIVGECPPVSIEAMTVPLPVFLSWWNEDSFLDVSSDIEGVAEDAADDTKKAPATADGEKRALVWDGDKSRVESTGSRIRPGETIVLPLGLGGFEKLGHIPAASAKDAAEWARHQYRRPWILRLHPDVIEAQSWPGKDELKARLFELGKSEDDQAPAVRTLFEEYRGQVKKSGHVVEMLLESHQSKGRLTFERYPDRSDAWFAVGTKSEADSGADESSSGDPIFLDDHLRDVSTEVVGFASPLLAEYPKLLQSCRDAAPYHDWGKADPRFQALLHGGDRFASAFSPKLLAKGKVSRASRSERRKQWERSGLPGGFRHELVSLILLALSAEKPDDDLLLHLIASHHGRCRPFAPVVVDSGCDFSYQGIRLSGMAWQQLAPHRIDQGIGDRFWRLTREHGWWGLAYLETIFRLGDWRASAKEQAAVDLKRTTKVVLSE
jgi:CRISPR-associated endonuclease/helicase Cas3